MGSQRQLLSQRAYARHREQRGLLGKTLRAVQKAIATGRISTIEGKIDPEVADLQWGDRTDPAQATRAAGQKNAAESPPPTGEGMREARLRRELAEAERAELQLAEMQAKLCRVEDVRRAARELAQRIVNALDQIPHRIAVEFGTDDEMRAKLRRRLIEDMDRVRREVSEASQ